MQTTSDQLAKNWRPVGLLGKIVDALVLNEYLRRFLMQRGAVVKHYAETDAWQTVLPAGN